MKKKTISLLFTLIFLGLCLIPGAGLVLTGGAEAGANEILAPRPRLTDQEGGLNGAVLTELADYIGDRFYLRQECVTAWAGLNAAFGSSVTEDVILGRGGWLYFAPTLPDYTRSEPMTARELWCAGRTLYLLQEYVESRGGQFLFTTAPNKNSLYDEAMPAYPRAEGESNAQRLQTVLADMGVDYLDLFSLFRAQSETLYFPADSHWNGRGAALAADAILSALGRDSAYFYGGFVPGEHRGDLYEMVYPAGKALDTDLVYSPGFTFAANSANPDSITLKTASEGGSGQLLMYRDSFGRNLYPYLAESFSASVFSRKTDYDPTAMADGGAVVVELVERNLRYLNANAPTLPAAARDASPAQNARPMGTLAVSRGEEKNNYVNYTGVFDDLLPDDASPVYVLAGGALYEAVPAPKGFSAWLEAGEIQQVIFTAGGELVSLSCVQNTNP